MSMNNDALREITRRHFFQQAGLSVGSLALSSLLQRELRGQEASLNPMAPIVEEFIWGSLGEGIFPTVPAVISLVLVVLTMFTGMWFFNREEAASVDKL
jgi:ABC-type polysaccharide/polyol phosphate export permease